MLIGDRLSQKWTALAAAKSGGGTPGAETSGRLDIKHRQRLAAFISAPFLHFRTPFCEPAALGAGASARGEHRLADTQSQQSDLLGCVCAALGRREEAGVESPAALSLSLPRRTPQSRVRTCTKVKTPHLKMSTNDVLKRVGRSAFISACHPREGLDDRCIPRSV
jgi:hypothetical protein